MDQRGKSAIDGKSQHFTGAASELYASYRLTANGHQVFLPAFTQSKADLVVDIDGTLTRVQVKTSMCINLTSDKRYGQFKQE